MFIVVMGVSGCGKTTIGRKLADRCGWPFYDGDDYHPAANIAKMAADIPLNDDDRAVWLETLAVLIHQKSQAGENGVLACSALKQIYREALKRYEPQRVRFVYLKGEYGVILARMEKRHGHFMKPEMLKSQFATLEEPSDAVTVDVRLPEDEIVAKVLDEMELRPG
jgi:gluconokinase